MSDPSMRQDRVVASQERERDSGKEDVKLGRQSIRNEFVFDALPTPPKVPGWHFVWLSTTNKQDTIRKRLQMGYVLVKPEECKELVSLKMHTGEYEGLVGVNEMILAKIPEDLYQDYMLQLHSEAPDEMEEQIRDGMRNMIEMSARMSGGEPLLKIEGGDGLPNIERGSKKPTFT